MRRSLFISVMVLRSVAAFGGEVTMNHPTIRLVASVKQMRDHCGLDGTYDACTQFVAYRLDAECSDARIRASVAITPLIVLYNMNSLPHENNHIDDMRGSLSRFVHALEGRTFDSDAVCRDAAAAVMQDFSSTVRRFARESLALRDPTLKDFPIARIRE